MMRYSLLVHAFVVTVLTVQAGALFAEEVDPEHATRFAQGLEFFKRDVRGVLSGRCVKCHGGESTEGEFDLNTREALLKGGANGPAVVLGKGKESRLYRLAAHLEEPYMPEDGAQLGEPALVALTRWIDLGAPYDKALVVRDDEDPLAWTRRTIETERREFWAFQPLRSVTVPEVTDPGWARTDIDAFVLAGLAEQGLSPNPSADRRRLLRRAYFDLLGLPPTAEETEAFLQDTDPRAYERLLDRLLENPHYGERWGRHWLDVARFAESHGFEQDYDRPHAFHYRDFVIKALNADMPYDQFVRWQIAGDEIEPDNPLALMATGFLGAGVFPTQLTEREFESARYDELDDMVATLGTAMLGLTVGCARCHDHKFDPIPMADYYRLIANFSATIRSNIELELDSAATQETLSRWEREHQPLVTELERFEREQLPVRFEAWRRQPRTPADQVAPWTVLDITQASTQEGVALTPQEDGSLLASGKNPDFDTYTLEARTHRQRLTGLRLEALVHDSFVRGGPGRAGNSNFALSSLVVTAAPLNGSAAPQRVTLVQPQATFQQNAGGLSIAASLDDDPRSGWAVDPQFGKDHAAVFTFAEDLGFPGGTVLNVKLEFRVNNQHHIGRPRLSVTSRARPVSLAGDSERQGIRELDELLSGVGDRKLTEMEHTQALVWYRPLDAEWLARQQKVQQHLAARPQPQRTQVMVTSEGFKPIPHHADGRGFPHFYPETYFLKRGDPAQKSGTAPPGFLQVLSRSSDGAQDGRWRAPPPAGWRTSYRRRALADWLTDTEQGAGQLAARVIANRLWQHHLGTGIVATPNDFGFQGARPTHPDLLDWLAHQLVADGWRLKPLHKLIMTSAVYLQSAQVEPANDRLDPDNQWLWRFKPRRLEAELIRDSILAVSGELDGTMFGPGTLDERQKRRSIYFMVKRSKLIPSMQLFDAPEPLVSIGGRPSTTIAPQALLFMNNPVIRECARALARRLGPVTDNAWDAIIRQAYLRALAREPRDEEKQAAREFLAVRTRASATDPLASPELALTDYCQVLLSTNEFVYVD